jgi:hypothetical protein
LNNNSRPHVTKTTQERIENMDRKVLPNPAYSPTGLSFVLISAAFLPGKKIYGSKKYAKSPWFVFLP